MDDLNLNNLMSQDEIANLFSDTSEVEEKQSDSPEENQNKEKEATEEVHVDTDTLFENPESVGSEEEHKVLGDTTTEKGDGSSPNFYSSIAKALKEDGILPDLDDTTITSISEAEDFARMLENQIQEKLDEKAKRYDVAINAGVDESVAGQYERTLKYLDGITEDQLKEDSKEGTNLRRQLIYQDLLNKGYKKDEALDELDEIFANGSDIKKATRALANNKDFFTKGYQQVIDDAKEEAANEEKERKQQAAELKKSILEDNKVFGELEVDKSTRQKIFDNISKPVYRDEESGEYLTAIQRYEMEHKTEFLKNVGLLFTLTDGFKNIDKLIQPKVKKEVRKGLRELEHTINTTSRSADGNLRFVSSVGDSESSIRKWDLDI